MKHPFPMNPGILTPISDFTRIPAETLIFDSRCELKWQFWYIFLYVGLMHGILTRISDFTRIPAEALIFDSRCELKRSFLITS